MKSSSFTLSSKTQYNTSTVSLISLEFILMTHKKITLQHHIYYSNIYIVPQYESEKAAAKIRNPQVYWSIIFEAFQGIKKRKAHIHTLSSKFYSPEQSSQANSRRVSDTRLILFRNHTGELVITASSRVRPQATDILVLQKWEINRNSI